MSDLVIFDQLEFGALWAALFLPLPVLVRLLMPPAKPRGLALKVPFFDQLDQSVQKPNKSSTRRLVFLILTWLLLVFAACRPQWIGENISTPVSGRDLMLAVDISGSMKARDMNFQGAPQDRLSAVKRVAGEFIERRTGDRVGLILFGTKAYLQAPLSLDRTTVNQLLQESAIGLAGEKTAIGDAIGLAVKRLNERPGEDKLLILLTDGANTSGQTEPLEAAELASLAGLRIHTIGFGAESSGQGSIFGSGLFNRRSAVDIATLREVAVQTGGKFFRATDSETLNQIYHLIDQLEPVEDTADQLKPIRELFHLPLGLVFIASLIYAVFLVLRNSLNVARRIPKSRSNREISAG